MIPEYAFHNDMLVFLKPAPLHNMLSLHLA